MITHLKDSLLYIVLFIFIFIAGFSDAAERPVKVGISGGQTRVKNNNTQQYQDAIHIGVTVGAQVVDTPSALRELRRNTPKRRPKKTSQIPTQLPPHNMRKKLKVFISPYATKVRCI